MNPLDEYESQKDMAVRRVPTVELIDRIIAYGRTLEARIVTLEEAIFNTYGEVCPDWVFVTSEDAMLRIREKMKGELDGPDD